MARRCFCAVALLSVLAVLARAQEEKVTVRFMQSEYSVERGEESVVVMLVVSDYSGHIKSDHDWFTLKITYTEETAQADVDFKPPEKSRIIYLKENGDKVPLRVGIVPPQNSLAEDCTTTNKTFTLTISVDEQSVKVDPALSTTTITIADRSVEECCCGKVETLERNLSDEVIWKNEGMQRWKDQLNKTLHAEIPTCQSPSSETPTVTQSSPGTTDEPCTPPPAAKPPTGIGAVLERTSLTVSWKKPEGGATSTSYMIAYKAIGSEDPELGVKVVFGCPEEDEEDPCSIILIVESEFADYNIAMATLNDGVDLTTAWTAWAVVLRAEPPTNITAELEGTRLTISWKEPVVGGTPTDYTIYYIADPGDEEGNEPVSGCTNEKDGLCSFVVTDVEANAATYNVTMVTHTKDSTMSSMSPRSAVRVAVRQTAGPPTDVSAVLVGGTRLTVSWKKPEGDPVPTGYVVRYDGEDIIVQPCTIPAGNCIESVNVNVTTDATADFEVTVKTVSEGNFDSPPAKAVKPDAKVVDNKGDEKSEAGGGVPYEWSSYATWVVVGAVLVIILAVAGYIAYQNRAKVGSWITSHVGSLGGKGGRGGGMRRKRYRKLPTSIHDTMAHDD